MTLLLPHHTGSHTRSLEDLSSISGGWMMLCNELMSWQKTVSTHAWNILCAASSSLAAEDIYMLVSSRFLPVF